MGEPVLHARREPHVALTSGERHGVHALCSTWNIDAERFLLAAQEECLGALPVMARVSTGRAVAQDHACSTRNTVRARGIASDTEAPTRPANGVCSTWNIRRPVRGLDRREAVHELDPLD